ncbi:MAG: hypothetical protein ACLUIO_02335 [Neglectibacter timonensis]
MTTAKRKPLSLLLTLLMLVSMVVNLIVPVYAAENVGTIYLVRTPAAVVTRMLGDTPILLI